MGGDTSDLYSSLEITIKRCNSTLDPFCVNDTIYNQIMSIFQRSQLAIPIINTLVNPSSKNYKEYYLEDSASYTFSGSLGNKLFAEIREDTI